ncbi:aldo/keto reductase [Bacillus sp. J14TS2]|uniref:aldo/keto reductase family protein n=1 Tax=Bacillus sp. J14TS2 TaxID=2807188 RepID=UPI001B29C103|nr:aldo/keto reductase [Bacillus sp. J14TS2]GIN74568.1 aldo/keto reductase [Bacillus sp. J14TS2]
MEFVTLSMGSTLPIVGSGTNTFGKVDRNYMGEINGDTTELKDAITLGYRHFDTAISYRNEAVVGKAVKESGLPRSEFFLTTKIPGKEEYTANEAAVRRGVEESLAALDTSYIDLYLIHHPWDNLAEIPGVWRVLEEYVDQGILKEIGVSNFDEKELGHLLEHARIRPAVNQIESHPGKWNDGIISYSLENQVIPEAWGPLTRVSDEAQEALSAIGTNYNKTWAQIILRYQIERGVVVIPKSHNKERQALNLEIFDFELTEDERKIIASL